MLALQTLNRMAPFLNRILRLKHKCPWQNNKESAFGSIDPKEARWGCKVRLRPGGDVAKRKVVQSKCVAVSK